jgi:hypothetical protein
VFLDPSLASFDTPPRHRTFGLDAVEGPAHGPQPRPFGHGPFGPDPYLPLARTGADRDPLVLLSLRPGNAHAALGADDDRAWPWFPRRG